MKASDFTTSILVENTPKEVFNAVNSPKKWWPGEITGSSAKINDEFTYSYKDIHCSKQELIELSPDKKVIWLVTESRLNYTEDINEWAGTKLVFEISVEGNMTRLKFSHQGLSPEIECFESCSNSWSQIIQQSLYSLITTGKGLELHLA